MDVGHLCKDIIDSLPVGLYFVDTQRKILMWNNKAEEITGYSSEEVVGLYCYADLLNHIDKEATPLCLNNCPLQATIEDGAPREAEVFLLHKNQSRVAVRVQTSPVIHDGILVGAIQTFAQTQTNFYSNDLIDSLTRLIITDKLTGLYNRRHGENVIEHKLLQTRYLNQKYGLVYIDLDNFAQCNNLFGHEVGDYVLKTITAKLYEYQLYDNILFRWGGEEFVGIFALQDKTIGQIAEELRSLIAETDIYIDNTQIKVTASIGATNLTATDTLATVTARGDSLMYQSKQAGKNCVSTDG